MMEHADSTEERHAPLTLSGAETGLGESKAAQEAAGGQVHEAKTRKIVLMLPKVKELIIL
ncbi:hypothetical protein sscle_05g047920 [Sclerotinia sclerotiorum 1980 UF-70]|uniref:Uncharacterized protein n=1 Tax=Sclerotinia sclerotiorum (strain ATCC 18683 / 1980 / Ss-1) TaxID=665079 RepID=A0A1D9Q5F4_SCLS1|nr:hypothetical protein sscle_05g047920 [Sclerotinia sclerotiorum 1980 UF-70]